MKGGARGGLPNCRFYNNFKLILQSTVHPQIYNLQCTDKIWLKSTVFAQKPKMQSANLQDFGKKKMQSTRIFSTNLQSTYRVLPPINMSLGGYKYACGKLE
jgi:hypothetical protein